MASKQINVCWLTGSYFTRKVLLNKIKSYLVDPKLYYYYDDNIDGEIVEAEILGNTLFEDESKIVVIKSIPKFQKAKKATIEKRFVNICSNVPDTTVLVFDNISSKNYKKLFQHVKKIGKVIESPSSLNFNKAVDFIYKQLLNKDINIEIDDCRFAVSCFRRVDKEIDFDTLHLFTEKLLSYIGKRKKVNRDDILAISDSYNSFVIWDFLNTLDNKDYNKCYELFYDACKIGKSIQDTVSSILNSALWKYKMLLFVKEGFQHTNNIEKIVSSVGSVTKFNKEGSQYSAIYQPIKDNYGKVISLFKTTTIRNTLKSYYGKPPTVSKYSLLDIVRAFRCCEEARSQLRCRDKSFAVTDVDALLMIDNLIMTVCGLFPDKILSAIRKL
jgi:DNA polymerase III delta subunit